MMLCPKCKSNDLLIELNVAFDWDGDDTRSPSLTDVSSDEWMPQNFSPVLCKQCEWTGNVSMMTEEGA